jgi:hypothetical protein
MGGNTMVFLGVDGADCKRVPIVVVPLAPLPEIVYWRREKGELITLSSARFIAKTQLHRFYPNRIMS